MLCPCLLPHRSRFVLRLFAGLITILILFELVAAIVTVAWLGDSDTTYKSKLLAGGTNKAVCNALLHS